MPTSEASATAVRSEAEERRTQAERSESTVDQLVRAARKLFASKGFAATSIEEIVRTAGVTRGALYHHFNSKEELFEGVYAREQDALAQRIMRVSLKKKGAWNRLKAGCDEFFTASVEPDIQRILMIDAPAVLGSRRIEEIECPHSINMIGDALEAAMEQGSLRKRPVMPLAQLLFGALSQAAMVAARSPDDVATTNEMRREFQRLLDAIEAT